MILLHSLALSLALEFIFCRGCSLDRIEELIFYPSTTTNIKSRGLFSCPGIRKSPMYVLYRIEELIFYRLQQQS